MKSFVLSLLVSLPVLAQNEIPLSIGDTKTVKVNDIPKALRMELFGNAVVQLSLSPSDFKGLVFELEGPLANYGDQTPIGQGPKKQITANATVVLEMKEPGVYRFIMTRKDPTLNLAPLTINSRCVSSGGCLRSEISQTEFMRRLRSEGRLKILEAMLQTKIDQYVTNMNFNEMLKGLLSFHLWQYDFNGLGEFPTLFMSRVANLREVVKMATAMNEEGVAQKSVIPFVKGNLVDLIQSCSDVKRLPPENVSVLNIDPTVPAVRNGHFSDGRLPLKVIQQSTCLAKILNALSLNSLKAQGDNDLSEVAYEGALHRDPASLMSAIIRTHRVVASNDRTYANFISFTYGPSDVRWPAWLDTGVTLSSGKTLRIPMGHSQHSWGIEGELINARIMWYLGISGAGFFANTSVRPAWTGQRRLYKIESGSPKNDDLILKGFDIAGKYIVRNRIESQYPEYRNKKADAYGFVGVCNDSNALIEKMTVGGEATTYPLIREKALDTKRLEDGLDDALISLPKDSEFSSKNDADVIKRVKKMLPHNPDSGALCKISSSLSAQIREIHGLPLKSCP